MKHNEFKAFFKKKLIERLPQYEVLSIDETLSNRVIYILNRDTLVCNSIIICWFGTNEFSIKIFDAQSGKNIKFNRYKDFIFEVSGNYIQTEKIGQVINKLEKNLLVV